MEKIGVFFTFGKFLALTPSHLYNRKRSFGQKLYFFVVIVLYTASAISSQYFRDYSRSKVCEMALKYFKDIIRHCHTFYILGPLATTKRHYWFKMIKIFRKNNHISGANPIFFYYFLAWHCLFVTIIVIWIRLCFLLLGLKFLEVYVVEFFQLYSHLFFMFFACVLLDMFRKFYESRKLKLDQMIRFRPTNFEKYKIDIFRLTSGIGIFNKIFGPLLILNILYICDMFLLYVNGLMKTKRHTISPDLYILLLSYRIGVIVFYWLHVAVMAVLADAISQQYDEIVHLANKLQLICTKMDRKIVEDFVEFIGKNRPEIDVAEFFILKRSTIFNILNFVIYFLIVIVQFK
ncbi:gustatory receptor 40 [Tribolium castaneum]|uniref:Gustatory receptor n=1 Tax=Tribolium castaneum TaxID=7070 RepID=D2A4I4_TRICA|nr:PREDICTED: uncharacterized protein LOC107398044 [Tribolium castaneum]EFA05766.1 gustatory receptor 40 [Tribolium castaneum]|eukprot:XP_015836231.1 PREDICTED: uncharacterized protein LOC107398044 [Tribolium castaneum]